MLTPNKKGNIQQGLMGTLSNLDPDKWVYSGPTTCSQAAQKGGWSWAQPESCFEKAWSVIPERGKLEMTKELHEKYCPTVKRGYLFYPLQCPRWGWRVSQDSWRRERLSSLPTSRLLLLGINDHQKGYSGMPAITPLPGLQKPVSICTANIRNPIEGFPAPVSSIMGCLPTPTDGP